MPENRIDLMNYRLESSQEKLEIAKLLLDAGHYKDSISRSYYALFAAVRALLALDGKDFSKHAGVIAYFQKEYIKTGRLNTKFSKYLSGAFRIRSNVDYADFYVVSVKDAQEQYDRAVEMCEAIREYLRNRLEEKRNGGEET